jgi:hypothetical protein
VKIAKTEKDAADRLEKKSELSEFWCFTKNYDAWNGPGFQEYLAGFFEGYFFSYVIINSTKFLIDRGQSLIILDTRSPVTLLKFSMTHRKKITTGLVE